MSRKVNVRAETAANDENTIEERLQALAEMVIYGASRREVMQFAEQAWGLSRRTAQEYLKRVQDRLTGEAAVDNQAFYLKLSQLQRDKLVGLAMRYAHDNRERLDPKVMQSLASLITAVRGLLDSRDRAAEQIHGLAVGSLRGAGAQAGIPAVESETSPAGTPEVKESCAPGPVQTQRTPGPRSESNGHQVIDNGQTQTPTPLSTAADGRSETPWPTPPKSSGRMELPPPEDRRDHDHLDCADCAGRPEADAAQLLAT